MSNTEVRAVAAAITAYFLAPVVAASVAAGVDCKVELIREADKLAYYIETGRLEEGE